MGVLRKAAHVKVSQLMVPIRAVLEASLEIDAAVVRQSETEDMLARLEQQLEQVRVLLCARVSSCVLICGAPVCRIVANCVTQSRL